MKAQKMVIFYDKPANSAASQPAPGTPDGDTTVRRVEADGNVVILDKEQVATGDHGVYENATDIMTLTGNVALSKGQNVTKGTKLVYNLGTGVANVDAGASGRVSSTFVPSEKPKTGAAAPVPPTKTTKSEARPLTREPLASFLSSRRSDRLARRPRLGEGLSRPSRCARCVISRAQR